MLCALCAAPTMSPHQPNTVFIPDFFVLASLIADILFVRDVGERQTWKEEQRSDETGNTHTSPSSNHPVFTRTFHAQFKFALRARTRTGERASLSVSSEKCDCLTTQILHYYAVATSYYRLQTGWLLS